MTGEYVVNGVDLTKPFSLRVSVNGPGVTDGPVSVWRPAQLVTDLVSGPRPVGLRHDSVAIACNGAVETRSCGSLTPQTVRADSADQYTTPRFWAGYIGNAPSVVGPVEERALDLRWIRALSQVSTAPDGWTQVRYREISPDEITAFLAGRADDESE